MKKMIVMIIGWMSLFVSGFAEAQVIRSGVTYYGGAQLELAGSDATFTVPSGWSGQYNPAEKLFEMYSSSGDNIAVGYEGKSYANAIAFAKQPITTSEGIVMTPINSEKLSNNKLTGEVFAYSGKALFILDVGAVAMVLKMPSGKALTVSSGGLGNNITTFANQVGLIVPTLAFAGQAGSKSPQSRMASANKAPQTRHSSAQSSTRHQTKGRTVAGVPVQKQRGSGNPDWTAHLSGRHWYYFTFDQYSGRTQKSIYLCADGTFYTSSISSYSSSGYGSSGSYESRSTRPNNEGRWKAINRNETDSNGYTVGTLQMNFFNGGQRNMRLNKPNEPGTMFNGTFYRNEGRISRCLD